MAATQRDVKQRIDSVKNIRKITRAMEMVAAARLRRAEQRIAALRPYAGAIRRMTRQAAEAAGGEIGSLPILKEHEREVGETTREQEGIRSSSDADGGDEGDAEASTDQEEAAAPA